MNLIDIYGDIFDSKFDKFPKAHCVSADLAMGKGIAVKFDQRYHIKDTLSKYYDITKPYPYPSCFRVGMVYNLVTKYHYYDKPTPHTMKKALEALRDLVEKDRQKWLVIPEIGCGLDKMKWDHVKGLIMTTFSGMDITIIVVHYSPKQLYS